MRGYIEESKGTLGTIYYVHELIGNDFIKIGDYENLQGFMWDIKEQFKDIKKRKKILESKEK